MGSAPVRTKPTIPGGHYRARYPFDHRPASPNGWCRANRGV